MDQMSYKEEGFWENIENKKRNSPTKLWGYLAQTCQQSIKWTIQFQIPRIWSWFELKELILLLLNEIQILELSRKFDVGISTLVKRS